jgi:DNA-binding LytR/AlgR family response regulator
MIKAIAIDDEPLALKVIEGLCVRSKEVELIKSFTSQDEALKFLKEFPVDLLFLDIQMPNKNGMSFYKEIEVKPPVIFTTAFSQYAVEGFDVEAVDYLLKPISFDRFSKSIHKIKRSLTKTKSENDFFHLRADQQLHKIFYKEILYVQSDDDYIRLFFKEGRPKLFRMTLKEIQGKLPTDQFIRVHRSYVVATNKIDRWGNKSIFIGETEIPIGSNYETEIKNLKEKL